MRYHVDPSLTGTGIIGGNNWGSMGDLVATLTYVRSSPSHDGDEIWALGGHYPLTAPLVINNNREPLSIYGGFDGWENTLCDRNANIDSLNLNFFPNASILEPIGGNRVINMQNANVCLIDGFVILNGNAGTGGGGGVFAGGRNLRFENLVFMGNRAGLNGGGMYINNTQNVMVKNAIFVENEANSGGGLCVGGGNNTLLVNVLFNDNKSIVAAGNGNAIYISGNNSVKIINNTISGNIGSSATTPSVYCALNSTVGIYNSIIYPDTLAAAAGANVTVDYSLLNQTILGQNPNGINPLPPPAPPLNPNFVNQAPLSAGGDYHLSTPATPPSPIDAGNTDFIFPYSATDLEGQPRFINNSTGTIIDVDMGALEVQ